MRIRVAALTLLAWVLLTMCESVIAMTSEELLRKLKTAPPGSLRSRDSSSLSPETVSMLIETLDQDRANPPTAATYGVRNYLIEGMRGRGLTLAQFATVSAWLTRGDAQRGAAIFLFEQTPSDDPKAGQALDLLVHQLQPHDDTWVRRVLSAVAVLAKNEPLTAEHRAIVLSVVLDNKDWETRYEAADILLSAGAPDSELQQISSAFVAACADSGGCSKHDARFRWILARTGLSATQRSKFESDALRLVLCDSCLQSEFDVSALTELAYAGLPPPTDFESIAEDLIHGEGEARFRAALRLIYAAEHSSLPKNGADACVQALRDSRAPAQLRTLAEQCLRGYVRSPATLPSDALLYARDNTIPHYVRLSALMGIRQNAALWIGVAKAVAPELQKLASEDESVEIRRAAADGLKALGQRRSLGNILESRSFRGGVGQFVGWSILALLAGLVVVWFAVVLFGLEAAKHWTTRLTWLGWSVVIGVAVFYGTFISALAGDDSLMLATLIVFLVNLGAQVTIYRRRLRSSQV